MATAEHSRAYRDRVRGAPPRGLPACGTWQAYKRHRRRGETVDEACRAAWAEYQAEWRQRKRGG